MRITQTHVEFWKSKQPAPSWFARVKRGAAQVSTIDSCINAHAGIEYDSRLCAIGNLLTLCRGKRGGELTGFLGRLVNQPGTVINPEIRSHTAARLLRKLSR